MTAVAATIIFPSGLSKWSGPAGSTDAMASIALSIQQHTSGRPRFPPACACPGSLPPFVGQIVDTKLSVHVVAASQDIANANRYCTEHRQLHREATRGDTLYNMQGYNKK